MTPSEGPDDRPTPVSFAVVLGGLATTFVGVLAAAAQIVAVVAIADDDGGTATTAEAQEGDSAVIDPDAEPGPDWEPYEPSLEPAPGGTEHEVTFHMTEQDLEVAPGVTQEMWTFEGQVPGPTLRGRWETSSPSPSSTMARSPTRSTSMPARWRGTTRCAPSSRARSSCTSSRRSGPGRGCTTAGPIPSSITSGTGCTAR